MPNLGRPLTERGLLCIPHLVRNVLADFRIPKVSHGRSLHGFLPHPVATHNRKPYRYFDSICANRGGDKGITSLRQMIPLWDTGPMIMLLAPIKNLTAWKTNIVLPQHTLN